MLLKVFFLSLISTDFNCIYMVKFNYNYNYNLYYLISILLYISISIQLGSLKF